MVLMKNNGSIIILVKCHQVILLGEVRIHISFQNLLVAHIKKYANIGILIKLV